MFNDAGDVTEFFGPMRASMCQAEPFAGDLSGEGFPSWLMCMTQYLYITGMTLPIGRRKQTIAVVNKANVHRYIERVLVSLSVPFRLIKHQLDCPFHVRKVRIDLEGDFDTPCQHPLNPPPIVDCLNQINNLIAVRRREQERRRAKRACQSWEGFQKVQSLP